MSILLVLIAKDHMGIWEEGGNIPNLGYGSDYMSVYIY